MIRYELIEPDMNEMFREEPSAETQEKRHHPQTNHHLYAAPGASAGMQVAGRSVPCVLLLHR